MRDIVPADSAPHSERVQTVFGDFPGQPGKCAGDSIFEWWLSPVAKLSFQPTAFVRVEEFTGLFQNAFDPFLLTSGLDWFGVHPSMERFDSPDQIHKAMLDVHRHIPERTQIQVETGSVLSSLPPPVRIKRAEYIPHLRKRRP